MDSDLTFVTNEDGQTLKQRFEVLIRDTRFFDVLVGYFYASGFHALYKSLEKTEKIRILIGINTSREVIKLVDRAETETQSIFQFSSAEVKQQLEVAVTEEMENSEDNPTVEESIHKFLEWLRSGKLEIRAYPSENIHAKLYIMTFQEGDRDIGRVITGSSNFTEAGLKDNLEFNVELKNRVDYKFAKAKFDELWKDAVDVKDKYIESIQTRTWLNDTISPYELYLKFLYEYFRDDLAQTEEIFYVYTPVEFKQLEYQEQAVLNARKILEEYGGVFISDVVGLGKTYIAAMLANQLDGRNLVIAPPMLLEKNNPGSWPNVFEDFGVRQTHFESLGKLDDLIREGTSRYKNVFIDEAHRFRTETTISYEKLAQICRGKRVILITATPYNNSPKDILSQIKLFQKSRKSTIPNLPDLEKFFSSLDQRLKNIDRQREQNEYIKIQRENAKEIREKVLKYLMVRRTRSEIVRYFADDLKKNNLKFPDVADPKPFYYQLNDKEDEIFSRTIELITNQFKYARYTPMLYYKGKLTQPEEIGQRNMGKFMKILLVKRLESSFYAFRNTIGRFIHSYERFLQELEKGKVYVSKKYINKIFELIENDDEKAIQRLIEEGKAEVYPATDFNEKFELDLRSDLAILKTIETKWQEIKRDPKFLEFKDRLKEEDILRKQKLIVFTESKETAEDLAKNLDVLFPNQVLVYTGGSNVEVREKVIENFDGRARFPKDDYRILVSTEILSEGVNLHRSNVIINYDIPWNPTRLMQRVGRINRVDTKFDEIYSFTFFPTRQSNELIKLKEAAEAKIHAFMTLLGEDARILTEGEPIGSHELFDMLISKKTITGEDEQDESELKYLQIIKGIRDSKPDLFEKIKRFPKKARTARESNDTGDALLTYFRKGKLQKFFFAKDKTQELDFLSAAKLLEINIETPRAKLGKDYYGFLEKNKQAFFETTTEEPPEPGARRGRDAATKILRMLKAIYDIRQFTEEQEIYLKRVIQQIGEGGLTRQTTKRTLQALQKEIGENGPQPLRILAVLQKHIPAALLESHAVESSAQTSGPREVILSEYFVGKNG
ncbi:MAG TPA: helicase-related protein [Candidatus Ratteibacteria bacterium]|uniref:ATP-dependent RNA helicase DbpA n=1 Tax=candidate division TA06 bacterium ADurb.Bin131 TaxID=1852827 RepID=A0A1V6C5W1_UNCT6|nr:MAG: ATP-dependent RNA helicase DbpA [candidate division TA06 bacterium ADurb.Bin131]HRS06081.1 helicase-related protein [Candidatus Ratteibacteria bacterium]HRV04168.1 helicase-related protein [Candidatus Ratteibacteria bacterium]